MRSRARTALTLLAGGLVGGIVAVPVVADAAPGPSHTAGPRNASVSRSVGQPGFGDSSAAGPGATDQTPGRCNQAPSRTPSS